MKVRQRSLEAQSKASPAVQSLAQAARVEAGEHPESDTGTTVTSDGQRQIATAPCVRKGSELGRVPVELILDDQAAYVVSSGYGW